MRVRLQVQFLQQFLARSALSQNHWAIRMGISRGHWSDLVNGRHPYPSPKTRQRMVEVLGVDANDLFIIEIGPTGWHDTDFRAALQERYLIERELGQGAMGAVYVALDVARNRRVAVKVLAPESVCGIGSETFLREISTVSRLHHPNILPLFDSGIIADHPYFVMPWVRAGSLRDRLRHEKRIDLSTVVAITNGIANGLTHTHREFVLHCDVKPENVLLHHNHPWLADFGISRIAHAEVSEWRTRKGIDVSAGTPAYVSPEQALGEELDGRTDVYSLGCVVYEMLTGRAPFEGVSTEVVVSKRFMESAVPITTLAPELPPAVAGAVARAMELDRERRPETPDAFAEELAMAAQSRVSIRARVARPAARAVGHVRRTLARRRSFSRWDSWWQDTRFAMRRLLREPLVALFVVCTLALGIGMNVSAFSVMDRVLLSGPQHVREPQRLIRVYSRAKIGSQGLQTTPWLPYDAFEVLRDNLNTAEGVAAYRVNPAMIGTGTASDMRQIEPANSALFPLLGVQPLRGRFFSSSEDASRVAVLSERYWRTVLGGDSSVIGRTLAIDDVPHTIIGVAPAGFTGPEIARVDAWIPISVAARGSMNFKTIVRLKPGATADAAAADIPRLTGAIESVLPRWAGWLRGASYLTAPIRFDDKAHEPFEAVMARWLAVISAIILIISCANVANLLLARLVRRRRELAVRMALGSGRSRVVRLLAMEGVILAAASAALALAVIAVTAPMVRDALFPNGAWSFELFDARIVGAVLAFTAVTALLVSVAPAIQAGGGAVSNALHAGSRSGSVRSPLRAALTVVQAMLSVVLLVGAGLFIRSLQRVHEVDLGMQPDRVLTVELHYPGTAQAPGESRDAWRAKSAVIDRARHRELVSAVRRLPGVEHAAVTVGIPFYGAFSVGVFVPGRDSIPSLPGGGPYINAVGDDYFATMGTKVLAGRPFASTDREGSEAVVIVNETMARVLWPGRNAIGECLQIQNRDAACARVVGIARDMHRDGLTAEASMQFYVPTGQETGFGGSYLLVRPRGEASASWKQLRDVLQAADPSIRSIDVRVLADGIAGQIRPFRLGFVAFGLSALLALIVAGLGLYSVMAHAVAWRRHEIGVRMALGAQRGAVARLVVGRGAMLATAGIVAGAVIVILARRWVEPLLFQTSATDPVVLGAVVITLESIALVAGWIPARRALQVSPVEALRAE